MLKLIGAWIIGHGFAIIAYALGHSAGYIIHGNQAHVKPREEG